eukprot:Pgem_evm1s3270
MKAKTKAFCFKSNLKLKHKNIIILIIFSFIQIASVTTKQMVIQFLKPNTNYSLWGPTNTIYTPWLVATILLSSFPIMLIMWVYESKRLKRTSFRIKNPRYRVPFYAIGAILEAGNQITSAFSLTSLNIVYYALLKLSSLLLSVVLFRLFTPKYFNVVHYIGFSVIAASIAILIVGGIGDNNQQNDRATFIRGIVCGIVAAVFSACQGLYLQIHTAREKARKINNIRNKKNNIIVIDNNDSYNYKKKKKNNNNNRGNNDKGVDNISTSGSNSIIFIINGNQLDGVNTGCSTCTTDSVGGGQSIKDLSLEDLYTRSTSTTSEGSYSNGNGEINNSESDVFSINNININSYDNNTNFGDKDDNNNYNSNVDIDDIVVNVHNDN